MCCCLLLVVGGVNKEVAKAELAVSITPQLITIIKNDNSFSKASILFSAPSSKSPFAFDATCNEFVS